MAMVRSQSPGLLERQRSRYIVEEADSFNTSVGETFWPRSSVGSINSPLVAGTDRDVQHVAVVSQATGRQSSFGMSVFNLMNAILGSGILGLSYAMAQSGIVLFVLLLMIVATLADFSIHLLLKMCTLTGVKSYEEVGLFALGVPGKILAASAILLQNIGSMSSYLFIVKDELPQIIGTFLHHLEDRSVWYLNGNYLVLLVVVVIILPLAILPKIGFLGYTSFLSILCMVFFTVVIVVKWFSFPCPIPSNHNTTSSGEIYSAVEYVGGTIQPTSSPGQNVSSECQPKFVSLTIETAYAIPTMAFSFVCHTAVLPVYCELSKPSKPRMQRVANTSIIMSFCLYMVSALMGYLTFYGNVRSELLDGYQFYDPTDVVILVVRVTVCVAIIFTIPLVHFPARKALMMIVSTWLPVRGDAFPWVRHIIATVTLITTVTCIAVLVPNLRQIFGIVGATASTSLVFILPPLFYLRLGKESLKSAQKISCLGLLVIGACTLVLCLAAIIYSMISA